MSKNKKEKKNKLSTPQILTRIVWLFLAVLMVLSMATTLIYYLFNM